MACYTYSYVKIFDWVTLLSLSDRNCSQFLNLFLRIDTMFCSRSSVLNAITIGEWSEQTPKQLFAVWDSFGPVYDN